ncbi:hypothetical protein HY628_00200 [Candidatus Uhrbacteria bacterium]|nr:hypothetical protein [Candidatus Uhrbacteria bacterium]
MEKRSKKMLSKKQRRVHVKMNHRTLAKKVEEGTQKAIKEYREVFVRLAEYDKT